MGDCRIIDLTVTLLLCAQPTEITATRDTATKYSIDHRTYVGMKGKHVKRAILNQSQCKDNIVRKNKTFCWHSRTRFSQRSLFIVTVHAMVFRKSSMYSYIFLTVWCASGSEAIPTLRFVILMDLHPCLYFLDAQRIPHAPIELAKTTLRVNRLTRINSII